MATKRTPPGAEWIGGIILGPGHVNDGVVEPYRPEVLVWMSSDGAILGSTMAEPGQVLGLACDSLQRTIERPMVGRAHAPARVRVTTPELARVLRAGHPGITFVCAPTPELDDFEAAMHAKFAEDRGATPTYLSPELSPDAIGAMFRAAAGLFRAQPWSVVPSDQCVFAVTIEQLDVQDAALCVIGQMGQSLGFILFGGLDEFDAYAEAGAAINARERPPIPPHLALNFEPGTELGPELRREVADHGWEIANPAAYPWVVSISSDVTAHPPDADELAIIEALCRALPKFLEAPDALLAAWNGGEAVERTLLVPIHGGEVQVTLRAPYDAEPAAAPEDALLREFMASPEARALPQIMACGFVTSLATEEFGAPITALGPAELSKIVFELIPRKVSVDACDACAIIDELRAFYAFLGRAHGLERAAACLRILDGEAVDELEAALSDPSKFGMAKAVYMAGRAAGFDMHTEEGIEAAMRAMEGKPLPGRPASKPKRASKPKAKARTKAPRAAPKRRG